MRSKTDSKVSSPNNEKPLLTNSGVEIIDMMRRKNTAKNIFLSFSIRDAIGYSFLLRHYYYLY